MIYKSHWRCTRDPRTVLTGYVAYNHICNVIYQSHWRRTPYPRTDPVPVKSHPAAPPLPLRIVREARRALNPCIECSAEKVSAILYVLQSQAYHVYTIKSVPYYMCYKFTTWVDKNFCVPKTKKIEIVLSVQCYVYYKVTMLLYYKYYVVTTGLASYLKPYRLST